MDKREVLMATSLGHRIAEDEAEALAAYFVETDQWRKVIAGEVDVVYGPSFIRYYDRKRLILIIAESSWPLPRM